MDYAGLSSKEAEKRFLEFGPNEIKEAPPSPFWKELLEQFKNPLVFLLVLAALVSLFLGEKLDSLFIFAIVILNALFGFFQEHQAKKALLSLKKMVTDKVRVIRDGKEIKIESKFLVPKDLVVLEQGDKVPADGVIIEGINPEVNEAALTGESIGVIKKETKLKPDSLKFDEENLLLMGTMVIRGRAKMAVLKTGMTTRFGEIAQKLSEIKEEPTPLEKQLSILGRNLGILALFLCGLVFWIGVLWGKPVSVMFLLAVSLAVAAIPEGLPAIVTITLAVGTNRMAKRKAIIRKLLAVEGLGAVNVICTDKTGTLTKNEMRVVEAEKNPRLLEIGAVCNTASLVLKEDGGDYDILGDTTEGALLLWAKKEGADYEEIREQYKIVNEIPFDPERRLMTVVAEKGNERFLFTKGAPEEILNRSKKVLCSGKEEEITDEERKKIAEKMAKMAGKGLRVLGFAYRKMAGKEEKPEERDLVFAGLAGIADPPRPEVSSAINICRRAGIRVMMITGDNALTAKSIGEEIGLLEKNDEIFTGSDMEKLTEEELEKAVLKVKIFARTSPLQKYKIVKALQKNGFIVAVTGDGVNDALALKQGDVGVAMGITGTEVAKETSEMIITDDNFSTIVKAIEEGRVIYDNIKKAVVYLLSCNLGEILAVLGGILINLPPILFPVQILWMNLVTDGLPALAIALNPSDPLIMKRLPREKTSHLLSASSRFIIGTGMILAFITLTAFIVFEKAFGENAGRASAFSIIVLGELIVSFFVLGRRNLRKNKLLFLTVFLTLVSQILILKIKFLAKLFKISG